MRRIVAAALLALSLLVPTAPSYAKGHKTTASAPATTADLQLFMPEARAQAHCPRDVVVWLNTNSGIYHEKGMRWYGNTKSGAYVCRKEADAAGNRDTRNGQ